MLLKLYGSVTLKKLANEVRRFSYQNFMCLHFVLSNHSPELTNESCVDFPTRIGPASSMHVVVSIHREDLRTMN